MSKPKFTPGPLFVRQRTSGHSVTMNNGLSVAWCGCGSFFDGTNNARIDDDEALANAQLFRAAPELYETLEECRAFVIAWAVTHAGVDDIEKAHPEHAEFFKKIEVVLAKARGEA